MPAGTRRNAQLKALAHERRRLCRAHEPARRRTHDNRRGARPDERDRLRNRERSRRHRRAARAADAAVRAQGSGLHDREPVVVLEADCMAQLVHDDGQEVDAAEARFLVDERSRVDEPAVAAREPVDRHLTVGREPDRPA